VRASDNYVPELSLVAEVEGTVIGHVMFSYAALERENDSVRVLVMAPVSVAPEWQSRGAGGAMIRAGIERAEARGEPLVQVLGHPGYYPRFGFERARQHGIEPPSPQVPDAAFMLLKLSAYDERYRGRIVYPPAFDVT
jgi:putative acetyltransferase